MDFTLSKEQKQICKAAREFAMAELPQRAMEFDREEKFDLNIWRKACELCFVGAFIDPAYDGAGYGFFEHCLINEEFWAVDPGMASAVLSATFGAELISRFGTDEQKSNILPRWSTGRPSWGPPSPKRTPAVMSPARLPQPCICLSRLCHLWKVHLHDLNWRPFL